MRIRSLLSIALISGLMSGTANAQQLIEADDGGIVSGYVSATGITRLTFTSDAAASVQMSQGGDGPGFSISQEQDQMELAARNTPSTQIEIRNPDITVRRAEMAAADRPMEERVVNLTRAMWNSALAEGFKVRRPVQRERAAGSLRLAVRAIYEAPDLTGRILSVRNPSPGQVPVSEAAFMAPGVLAVTLQGPRTLGSGQSMTVLVIDRVSDEGDRQ